MNEVYGYRDTAKDPISPLNDRMLQSPTGLQMSIDGSFLFPLRSTDPSTDPAYIPPNGTGVLWKSGTSLFLSTFTRDTGWVAAELTP